jgi:hypothetical protein
MLREGVWGQILRDWNIMSALTLNSGQFLTARVLGSTSDAGGTGATGSGRADATGLAINAGNGYFNTLAFAVPVAGTFGNAARNTIPAPGTFLLSASVGRSFRIGDNTRRQLEVRAEAENLLNHVNVTGLGTVVNALDYGLATNAGSMRSVNLTLRLRF